MYEKILASFTVMSIIAVIAFNLNLNTKNETNNLLTIANTEAWASGEIYVGTPCMYKPEHYCHYYWPDGSQSYELGIPYH